MKLLPTNRIVFAEAGAAVQNATARNEESGFITAILGTIGGRGNGRRGRLIHLATVVAPTPAAACCDACVMPIPAESSLRGDDGVYAKVSPLPE
ncbi:hypothetical protein GCM10011380_29590 [Sphingomonas metalli]|uniref:Uncharacterized protein n=1 Tax=Sphingomonas metalli TaxID=1779358 RepID=A0A916WVX2_9SPHN|nr:hypothetical protein GCM10011380_29590 [Sphingomonas metalli]